jgi:hypothetical protein
MSLRLLPRRPFAALLSAVAVAALASTPTASAGEATWQFAPASAPPPPAGVAPANFPVALGEVGDVEFWAPNRGLLITGGDPPTVPAGLYAYNGESWHQLSTVCGGAHGRIVWAGPEEFWTISDERSFQLGGGNVNEITNVSLCHFLNGQIVGSYAEPFNQPGSYQEMRAGGCLSPSDCWFGGALGVAPNFGAFHLHWDGQNVSVVYAPQDHAIASMALLGAGTLLESVGPVEGDNFEGEEGRLPSLFHQVGGSSNAFTNLFLPDSSCAGGGGVCPPLPNYGTDSKERPVAPLTLGPFTLNSDYHPAQPSAAAQLWAVAAPSANPPKNLRSSEGIAHTIVLRYSQGAWSQVVGSKAPGGSEPFTATETPTGAAAEPGVPAAWVTIASGEEKQANVDRLTATGEISSKDVLGPPQGVGSRGTAGPITCPAQNDCWLATNQGWLFHLTEEAKEPERTNDYPVDTDPNFAGVITYRPPDPSVPRLPPIEPPVDDSLANQAIAPPVIPEPINQLSGGLTTMPAIEDIRSRLTHRDTLELTFKLTVKTRVQFLANRHGKVVARTRLETLAAGTRKLSMLLNPRHWPTKIDLKATPLQPLLVEKTPTSNNPNAVPPPAGSNTVGT